MKQKLALLFVCMLGILLTHAQAPNAIPYQGVARNASGDILASQTIRLRMSIHTGTATGTVVYQETFNPTTNLLGLFNVNIGTGTVVSGTMASIDWSSGNKYLQVEMDGTGGTTFTDMGTTQFMSVPYALYAAKSAASAHYLGENYGGGIVFFVYDNGLHGLIAAPYDQSTAVQWYNGNSTYMITKSFRTAINGGRDNSNSIIQSQGSGIYAAWVAMSYQNSSAGGVDVYGDWYLPSRDELYILYRNRSYVGNMADALYWSSTEFSIETAYIMDFSSGLYYSNYNKGSQVRVRAIRAF